MHQATAQITQPTWETIYDHPDQVHSRFIDADGYRTHYLEAGAIDAEPVVLVHGANFQLGVGVDRWFPTIVPLSRSFRVFAVDELGGGHTDPPRNLEDIGDIRVRADHVLHFIESLNVGPVHLVGQSQGAWIVAYVALLRPDLVRQIVLVDSASLALPAGGMGATKVSADFAATFRAGTMFNEDLRADEQSVRDYIGVMMYDRSLLPPEFFANTVPLAHKWLPIWDAPWRRFWADGGERNRAQYLLRGKHLSEFLPELPAPPFIIWGKNSVKGIDSGVELFKRLPDAQFHVFDKANHFLWIDQWHRFNSLVTWYLKTGH